jgi:transposase
MPRRTIIGLDIHKRETQACIMDAKGHVLEERRFPTSEAALRRALKDHPESETIIETTGLYRPVSTWLLNQGHEVHLAVTTRIEKPKVKTDKKDARHLASLYRADLLPEAYLPPPEVQRLRDMVRQREFLGKQLGKLRTKVKHDLLKHGHLDVDQPTVTKAKRAWCRSLGIHEINSCLTLIDALEAEKERFEKMIELEVENVPDAKLLMTIPGVSSYTALFIVAEVGEFRRFAHRDQLASLAGFSVKQYQSGDNDVRGRITRQGRPLLRYIVGQAAKNHVHYCPESALSKRHRRIAKRRGQQKALIATARVLLTIMYTMVTRSEPFKVNPS